MSLLEAHNLHAGYGDIVIVRGASIHVEASEIVT